MIDKQVKQIVKKITVNDYVMENMFCAPKGALGRLGGQLMSQDRWLPAWVLDLLEINPTDSVLEVGPGPGLGLQLAAARAHQGRVAGVDRSETMLRMARQRNRALIEAGRIELHLGSADKLPFDDATFDKAMTINSHHIWLNPVAGLREIRRTLRPGGRIAIAITRFSYASPENFESLLIDAGFTDISIHTAEAGTCALGQA
ncbi:MAG TPA: methyltransferase domain-containing protein [Anaerolineales bacterium]|nr:methyltransferase domain-containing protein [Anaerolineales bacterium]